MGRFVPVEDNETPLCEQRAHDPNMAKHRQWDSFVIARDSAQSREMEVALKKAATDKPKADRGWERGSVGWGVLGSWGNDEKDQSAQVARVGEGRNKMVRNEKGLWVKASSLGKHPPTHPPTNPHTHTHTHTHTGAE